MAKCFFAGSLLLAAFPAVAAGDTVIDATMVVGNGTTLDVSAILAPKTKGLEWPALTKDTMPGTRWWWMGSAVNPTDLKRELATFRKAGLGTVEVTPIYGVKGCESQFIEFLSPKWMDMLKVTVSEAQRLDMNADMVTGTGWCFGGPNVGDNDANALAMVKTFDVGAGATLAEKIDRGATQALVAFGSDGRSVDLTGEIGADGTVDWKPTGGGPWRVYAVSQKPSGMKVKRPAPGGAGWMLNLLYPDAMPRYLQRFADALAIYDGAKPHAQFHDSYEYKSDWAPDFLEQFERRRGYKLQGELPALFESKGDADHIARVKADYRETVSDLVEDSVARWTKWSHREGALSREQAHGSPGNWLDIYAAADIPETEMFNQDRDVLVSKFASSAAHVTGRNLTSSETGTWVAEHFTETLADLKYLFDDMFLSGVNRVMYHGTAYSPADAPWPGWCFYASAEMNPRNAIWHDVPALNAYAARVQGMLQSGRPDNDILLYWPLPDYWHNADGMMQQFSIHGRDWFESQAIGKTAQMLRQRGYTFDYISDKLLQNAKVDGGTLDLFENAYRVILVPACDYLPLETLQKLSALADAGATVIFADRVPHDVPGLADLERRRAEFRKITPKATLSAQLDAALARAGVRNEESLTRHAGVDFVRRAVDDGCMYFIANRGAQRLDESVMLTKPAAQVAIMNPINGRIGLAGTQSGPGGTSVHLQLEPGESLILRTFEKPTADVAAWDYWRPVGEPTAIRGKWNVKFLAGGPTLPKEFTTETLGSWTKAGGKEAESFGGTALYTLRFDAPAAAGGKWALELGRVSQSARVRLNGRNLGTVFTPPFRVLVDELKPRDNVLEVEVTSTSANRIRDLDQRGVKWKIFYDVNVLSLKYKPFDASKWPIADSGLLGPVTLQVEAAN